MVSLENDEKQEAIWITPKAKVYIDSCKIHLREPYYSVVDRILFENAKPLNSVVDRILFENAKPLK